jgi:hypothetical protein
MHLGYVALKINPEYEFFCANQFLFVMNNIIIQQHFINILKNNEGYIDCKNLCPTHKRGCNLTNLQIENFYKR